MQRSAAQHFFSVDVEEHFQVSVFDGIVGRDSWSRMPSRVEENTERILDLLAARGATGTFFILGWVAHKKPNLVRRIVDAGHEAASHGYSHRRVSELTPEEFRHDLRLAKQTIEDVAGLPVLGFRAPSFSIAPGMEWAYEILIEEGHVYDSSMFPIRRPGYGNPGAAPIPHVIQTRSGHICEFPLATTTMLGLRLPAAGGAYLRHLPYPLTRRAFTEHAGWQLPAMFYIHPWEIDVDQPRIAASPLTTLRHYGGLRRTQPRLERLLSEFTFCSVRERLPDIAGHSDSAGLLRALS